MNRITPRGARRVASWLTFVLALTVYILTLEPDASLWDCPEYLVTAALLEMGHPPGNPVWTLTARIFSMLGGSDPQHIAVAVNLSSAIFTAGAAALLTSVCFIMLRRLWRRRDLTSATALTSLAAGLTFAWLDSTWYSAVEAEVYAMSLFLSALSVRLMAGWAFIRNPRRRARQMLLIIYLTGLSIGVHQLNLLVIPALALIWLFHRCRRPGFLRILLTLAAGAAAVGILLLGFMPGVMRLAGYTELFCVNTLRMPLHSGVWVFWAIAITMALGLGAAPAIFRHHVSTGWQVALWTPAMLLIGFSAYMLILVRGAANPPMNEGAPSTIFALAEYLDRDQYGKNPLLYGRTPHSRPMRLETIRPDGSADYSRYARQVKSPRYLPAPDGRSYRHFADKSELIYTPELDMWLPRLTSSSGADIACYADWAGMYPEEMTEVEISYAIDSLGNPVGRLNPDGSRSRETELRPTYLQQLRYLAAYQIGYMYFRYLLWNFSGRQNDRFATGEVEHGNFITGIPAADDMMLGHTASLPDEIGNDNPGRNRLFMIPLLLGIAGIAWMQCRGGRGRRANLIIAILFLMTGLAIVLYLNQSPREPRERDYSFLGSFWAYTLWVGAGMYGIILWLTGRRRLRRAARWLPALTLALPAWVLAVNYDDHDRSNRSVTTDFAANLLESLDEDAILFTNGDNFTFPLWWAQEVAGIRRDVTIINTAYLATPWYVCQLMMERPGYSPAHPMPGLQMQARDSMIRYGAFASNPYVRLPLEPTSADTLAACDAIAALRQRYSGSSALPAMLRLPTGFRNYSHTAPDDSILMDSIYIRTTAVASGSATIGQRQLAVLDIVASTLASPSPRPVYWLASLSSADYAGFYPFTTRALHTRRLVMTDRPDSLLLHRMLDRDLLAARLIHSGRRGSMAGLRPDTAPVRSIYADATLGPHIVTQRLGMLRLAQRLLAAGRREDALEVTRTVQRLFPPEICEYQICNETEGALYEGIAIATLLRGSACGPDSTAIRAEADSIFRREKARHRQWTRYYQSLPPRLRNVLTPKHRQWIANPPKED
ncbi:MAG: DUF2723 domain-containing protein [Muribaculaceae bacterium]|nr:DUF2723 domain-containing protein [Muribaculaceae bacterium]